jgi:hypothetical protein
MYSRMSWYSVLKVGSASCCREIAQPFCAALSAERELLGQQGAVQTVGFVIATPRAAAVDRRPRQVLRPRSRLRRRAPRAARSFRSAHAQQIGVVDSGRVDPVPFGAEAPRGAQRDTLNRQHVRARSPHK